jgi:hypothetical protein
MKTEIHKFKWFHSTRIFISARDSRFNITQDNFFFATCFYPFIENILIVGWVYKFN